MEFREERFKGRSIKLMLGLLSIGGCEFVRSKSEARSRKRRGIFDYL